MIYTSYFEALQTIIVKDAVVHSFARCTFAVNILECIGVTEDSGVESEVAILMDINSASVALSVATFHFKWALVDFTTFKGATELMSIVFVGISAPGTHLCSVAA